MLGDMPIGVDVGESDGKIDMLGDSSMVVSD